MIYTKVELTPGVTINLDVDPDELYTICPGCGIEHNVDYDLAISIADWSSRVSCGSSECNKKTKRKD